MRGTSGQPGSFDALYGFLQVIIILIKPGIVVNNPFLLCWHGESLAGSTDSIKPQALRVTSALSSVSQGLTESAPPALRKRAPAKQKNAKGERFRGSHASDSEVLSKRKIEREGFRRKPDNCLFLKWGVKEVKGLSNPQR